MSALPHRPGATSRRKVVEVVGDEVRRRPDTVVTEEPMEIRLSWPGHPATRAAVVMRTPGSDFELAAGFLLSDGVIGCSDRPHQVAYCVDRTLSEEQRYNVVTVELDGPPQRHPSSRTTSVSSACGVCGTESLDEVFTPADVAVPDHRDRRPRRHPLAAGLVARAAALVRQDGLDPRIRGVHLRR